MRAEKVKEFLYVCVMINLTKLTAAGAKEKNMTTENGMSLVSICVLWKFTVCDDYVN